MSVVFFLSTAAVSAKPPVPPPAPAAKRPPVPHTVGPQAPVVSPPPRYKAVYIPRRNTYTIQLGHNHTLQFDQRIVGMQELQDKIRMVSSDRPKPLIVIQVVDGVDKARLDHTVKLLNAQGFNEIKIEHLGRRLKAVPHRKVPSRVKR